MLRNFQFDLMIKKLSDFLTIPNIKEVWQEKRRKMLSEKIDVAAFWRWFIEHYPDSVKILKQNPDYQNKFSYIKKHTYSINKNKL